MNPLILAGDGVLTKTRVKKQFHVIFEDTQLKESLEPKKHQLGIKGEVKPCEKTPEDVKILLKNHFDRKQAAKDASYGPAKELPMQIPTSASAPSRPLHDELENLAELSPMPISFAILTTREFSATKRGKGFYNLKDTRPCRNKMIVLLVCMFSI